MAQKYESYRVTLSFSVEKDLLEQVDTFARKNERSRSSMIRVVLREWVLDEMKKEKQPAPKETKSIFEREQEEAAEKKARDKERTNRPPTGNIFDAADSED